MVISTDDLLRWIEDLRDSKNREMERASRRGDANACLLAVGGKDALESVENRIKVEIAKETLLSHKMAAKQARKVTRFREDRSA